MTERLKGLEAKQAGVLLIRSLELSQKTRERLARHGIASHLVPLAKPKMLDPPPAVEVLADPTGADEIIFSSPTAVAMFGDWANGLDIGQKRAWCVGKATGEAARELGFLRVEVGSGDGEALLQQMLSNRDHLEPPILHAAPRERSVDFAARLVSWGIQAMAIELYTMMLVDCERAMLLAGLKRFSETTVFLYSERMAAHFFALCGNLGLQETLVNVRFVAISPKVASLVPRALNAQVLVAQNPREDSMIEIIA